MKILAIGDPHGNLEKIKRIPVKNIDLILLTGDIGKALNIPELFRKAKRANFIIAVIVGGIIVGVIMSIILGVTLGSALFSMLPVIMMGGTMDIMALQAMIMSLLGVAAIGSIIALIVGYILDVFYITLIAESYK